MILLSHGFSENANRGSPVRTRLAPRSGFSEKSGNPFFTPERRNTNDFRAYSANRECTKKYANVNISGTRRGTRNGYPTNDTGTMRTEKNIWVSHPPDRPGFPQGQPVRVSTPERAFLVCKCMAATAFSVVCHTCALTRPKVLLRNRCRREIC